MKPMEIVCTVIDRNIYAQVVQDGDYLLVSNELIESKNLFFDIFEHKFGLKNKQTHDQYTVRFDVENKHNFEKVFIGSQSIMGNQVNN